MFLTPEPETCPSAPENVTMESTVTNDEGCAYESTDGMDNDCGLQIAEFCNEGSVL